MTSTVTLVGTTGRDPELRYTPNGTPVANFSMAVNRRWKSKTTDQWEESTSWFNVVCWQDLAQNVADSVTKGTRVIVSGRLEQRSWETDQGERRSVVEVVADSVGVDLRWATAEVHKNERSSSSSGGGGQAPPAAYDPAEEPF